MTENPKQNTKLSCGRRDFGLYLRYYPKTAYEFPSSIASPLLRTWELPFAAKSRNLLFADHWSRIQLSCSTWETLPFEILDGRRAYRRRLDLCQLHFTSLTSSALFQTNHLLKRGCDAVQCRILGNLKKKKPMPPIALIWVNKADGRMEEFWAYVKVRTYIKLKSHRKLLDGNLLKNRVCTREDLKCFDHILDQKRNKNASFTSIRVYMYNEANEATKESMTVTRVFLIRISWKK